MKKKNFLSGISAKLALLVLAMSGAVLTGCYKDDGLDPQKPNEGTVLESAVYTISGTVTDIATGANLSDYHLTVEAGGSTFAKTEAAGSYTVKFEQFPDGVNEKTVTLTFSPDGYTPITKTVVMYRVKDGNAVNYPLSVAMKKNEDKLVDVLYNLSFIVKDAATGVELDLSKFKREITPAATNGNYEAGIYTVRTFGTTIDNVTYLPSSTMVELPADAVKEGENNIKPRSIVLYVSKADSPVDTYVNFSGSIVDKYGKLLQAETIELFTEGNVSKGKVTSNSNFRFTIKNSESAKRYYVKASITGQDDVKSAIYDINGGNVDCVLMFSNLPADPAAPVAAKYNLYVNVLDANTKIAILGATIKVNDKEDLMTNLDPGVYTIDVTAAGYHTTRSMVALEKVMSDKATTIDYVATVYMTPAPQEVVWVNFAGQIFDKQGKPLTAKTIELFKEGKTDAVASKSQANSFSFSVSAKEGGKYWVKATYEDANGIVSTVESTKHDINNGNVDCTLIFANVDQAEDKLEYAKYDVYVNVLAAGTEEKLSNATVSFDGSVIADKKLMNVAGGKVIVVDASADKYYATSVLVDLPKLKVVKGSPNIIKVVTAYLTKQEDIAPTKLFLAGNVYDKRNILARAQAIKLMDANGKVLDQVYGTDHYKFEVLAPEAKAAATWTVVAEVINADETGIVKAFAKYTYTAGMTEAYSDIAFLVDIEDGKVVKKEDTSTLDPSQDENGEVENTVSSVIDKEEGQQTTLKIEAGTVITDANNNPVLTSLVIIRDKSEEADPSGDDTTEGEQTVAPRCYEGLPDGIYFSKPLEFAFTDVYGGQLGTLDLQYYENGNWSSDNAKDLNNVSYKEVALSGGVYTMKVPHFSKFRASAASKTSTTEIKEVVAVDGKELMIDKNNNTDQPVSGYEVSYKGKVGGWAFDKPIEEVVKASKFTNANAQKVVIAAIKNYLYNQYKVEVGNELKETTVSLATYTVPAYTYFKSVTVKFTKVEINFTFSLNGIEVPFTVYTYETVDATHAGKFEVIKADMVTFGHGHGHGHGGDLNAGGGIIVSE